MTEQTEQGDDRTSTVSGTGRYAAVNGVDLYHEVHGAGRPLVLLHGGLGSGEMSARCSRLSPPPTR